MSSSSTTGSSGFFVVWMNCHHERPARDGRPRDRAVRNDRPSSTIATASTTYATIGDSMCSRVDELLDALEHREHRAEREQHQRHHERPEVALGAVSERVRGARCALAARGPPRKSSPWLPVSATEWIASASIDAEPVIAKATNFDDRDPEVGEERRDDRPPGRLVSHRARPSTVLVASRTVLPSARREARVATSPARSPRTGR